MAICFDYILFISAKEAQAKWKSLRDYFRRELKKIPPPRSGDPGGSEELKSNWVYFKQMLFLKDQFMPRPSQSNLSIATDDNDFDDSASNASISLNSPLPSDNTQPVSAEDNLHDPVPVIQTDNLALSPHSIPSTSTATSVYEEPRTVLQARRRTRKSQVDSLLEIEKQKLEYIQNKRTAKRQSETAPDEDSLFFESLIPHVKKIADSRKLSFRNEIQNIVQRYAYPVTQNLQPPQPHRTQLETFNYDNYDVPGLNNSSLLRLQQENYSLNNNM